MIETLKKIYNWLEDDISKDIYLNRLKYLLTDDLYTMTKMGVKYCDDLRNNHFHTKFNENDNIIVYGCGNFGRAFLNENSNEKLKVKCFCDRNEALQINGFGGYTVISPQQMVDEYSDEKIIIASIDYYEEIKNFCLKNGIPEQNIYSYFQNSNRQYFLEDFIRINEPEVFIDAGALNLDTSVTFKNLCPNSVCYAFEPDPDNYNLCRELINNYPEKYRNIKLLPYGTWDSKTTLYFLATNNGGSHISDDGGTKIDTITIDEAINEPVTFIKMDIEGAELKALEGAKNTIQKYKPKLAICIYHKPEDIIEIPLYIKSIAPEYRFYIRHYTNNDCETVLYAVT